jgi:hypothetical protein
MKKHLWVVVALILLFSFAGIVAADSSHVQQDQAFLHALVQPAQTPGTEAATEVPPPFTPPSLCSGASCKTDFNCYAICGGFGSSYCESGRCNYL